MIMFLMLYCANLQTQACCQREVLVMKRGHAIRQLVARPLPTLIKSLVIACSLPMLGACSIMVPSYLVPPNRESFTAFDENTQFHITDRKQGIEIHVYHTRDLHTQFMSPPRTGELVQSCRREIYDIAFSHAKSLGEEGVFAEWAQNALFIDDLYYGNDLSCCKTYRPLVREPIVGLSTGSSTCHAYAIMDWRQQ